MTYQRCLITALIWTFSAIACSDDPAQDTSGTFPVQGNNPPSAGSTANTSAAGSSAPVAPTAGSRAPITSSAGTGGSTTPAATTAGTSAAGAAASGGVAGNGAAGDGAALAGTGAVAGATSSPSAGSGGIGGSAGATPPVAGSDAPNAPLPPVPVEKPTWAACDRTYECAKLKAPIDYRNPSAGMLELALKRRVARGDRIGALLINPGGPGGSGVDFLSGFMQTAGARLNERFDIVAFDPRGVGGSTPIDCHSTLQELVAADPSPDDEAEWKAIDDVSKRFADECGAKHAALLPHLGTWDVARDLDRIREALGESKLNYLGYSYGTEIGSYYAELFPQNVRALVLDGALDNSLSSVDISYAQGLGFELALNNYFEWCAGAASRCRWAGTQTPLAAFDALMAGVETKPLSGERPVGPGEFALGTIFPLYGGEDGWTVLSSALSAASRGDGSTLLNFVDGYLDRKPDGSYSNIQDVNNAVNCLDRSTPDYAGLRAEAERFAKAAPHFGMTALTGLLTCAHWPVPSTPHVLPMGRGAAPIVVIGTTGDPATPYEWAEALAVQLESAVLLTYEGEGHTAYGRGVPCIDSAVEAYFTSLQVPEDGKRCANTAAAQIMPVRMPRLR